MFQRFVMKQIKTPKQMERNLKGLANHWRLRILLLLSENGGLSLLSIADAVGGNFKTIAEHTRRLHIAGLIVKRYRGREVIHNLSPYGEKFTKFVKTFQHS